MMSDRIQNKTSLSFRNISFFTGFTVLFFLTVILFFIGLLTDPLKIQQNLFFHNFNDLFADFFNHIIYVADRSPYLTDTLTARDRILPPLHYVLAYGIRQLLDCPMELNAMWRDRKAMSCAIAFLVISEVWLLFMLSKLTETKKRLPILMMILFSGVNMFAIERGTMVLFTTGCIAGFLHYYDSHDRKKQLLALVLLSLAAALKIYPALFGLLLLKKRDWKGILFCIILTSALGFLPLLTFVGRFENIETLFGNLKKYREYYAISSQHQVLRGFPIHIFHISSYAEIIKFIVTLTDVIAVGTLCTAFLNNNQERLALAIAAVITLCPVGAAPYTQCYLFMPFLLFLNRVNENSGKLDLFMAAGYILLLTPYQFAGRTNEIFILFVLPAMLICQCLSDLCKLKKSRKNIREIITDCFNIKC